MFLQFLAIAINIQVSPILNLDYVERTFSQSTFQGQRNLYIPLLLVNGIIAAKQVELVDSKQLLRFFGCN